MASVSQSYGWLLDLLNQRAGGNDTHGFDASVAVPCGLATSAALELLKPLAVDGRVWTSRSFDYRWNANPPSADYLVARGRVISVTALDAWIDVRVATDAGTNVFEGRLRAVATQDGAFVGAAKMTHAPSQASSDNVAIAPLAAAQATHDGSPADHDDVAMQLLRVRPRILDIVARTARFAMYPDIARLLCYPAAGASEPIGRFTHPIGGMGLSAAIGAARAARAAAGIVAAQPITSLNFVVRNAWGLDDTLVATAPLTTGASVRVRVVRSDNNVVATAVVGFD